MGEPSILSTKQGRKIAYHRSEGQGPCVVFLGGLKSDMQGTKAVFLEDWARAEGRSFLRFDYSGHGESSGDFTEGCIGDWAEDTAEAVAALTDGPIIPVGSSMGGWQALLLARSIPERIAGMVVRLLEHSSGADMQLRLVKGADHRFSDGPCLEMLLGALGEVLAANR